MRSVRLSKTFLEAFDMLLAQGEERIGALVVAEKRAAVKHTIENFLASHPSAKRSHRRLRLHVYPITDTPVMRGVARSPSILARSHGDGIRKLPRYSSITPNRTACASASVRVTASSLPISDPT